MKTKILYILIFALAFVASSCKRETSNTKPTITVSLEPQKFFLDKIVGDSIEVVCLLQNGANPENYEPSVNDLMAIENSVAYIKMGNVGFEQVLIEKISQNKSIPIYNCSKDITLIMGTHDCCEHHNHEHGDECSEEQHHHESSADPHTWTSIKNAKIIARNMLDVVVKVDSANANFYTSNYNNLISALDSLDNYATTQLASHKG